MNVSRRKTPHSLWKSFLFLQDLKGTLAQELDFENEARNSERCAKELKHFKFVVVPKVFWEQTSKVSFVSVSRGCLAAQVSLS